MANGEQPKRLTSIVAIDRNGAIGAHNSLPWRLKSDLKFFKQTTSQNTVVMGRKTYESIGGCLPHRQNVILSHKLDLFESTSECRLVHSIDEALFEAEKNSADETFIVGGALTYSQFAHLVDRYLVTVVDCEVDDADAFLTPDILSDFARWEQNVTEEFPAVDDQDDFPFTVYEIFPDNIGERQQKRQALFNKYSERIKRRASHSSRNRRQSEFQQLSWI